MHISYQPLWDTLKERGMRKEDLRLAAGLTTNMIANMGKGEHISMKTLLRICWVEFIKCMRSAGVQIDALAQYVKLFVQGDDTIEQRKNILIEQRKKLEEKIKEQRKTLALLKAKIENYESVVLDAEKNLK